MSGKVFVTGDSHGTFSRFSFKSWPEGKTLDKDDYLIIAGDFGGVWDDSPGEKKRLAWLNEKPWTTLFIDGNHENFDMLNKLPIADMFGAGVGVVASSIFHLKRGFIYTVAGNRILTIGGGLSIDKKYRIEGKSWWAAEELNNEETERCWGALANRKGFEYVISHVPPQRFVENISSFPGKIFDVTAIKLEDIYCAMDGNFKKWYHGHMHADFQHDQKMVGLYKEIVQLGNDLIQ